MKSLELLKTFTLVSLVGLSLVLTYRLWFGSPDYETISPPVYERLTFGEAPPLESLFSPERIILSVYREPYQEEEVPAPRAQEGDPEEGGEPVAPTGEGEEHEEEEGEEKIDPGGPGEEMADLAGEETGPGENGEGPGSPAAGEAPGEGGGDQGVEPVPDPGTPGEEGGPGPAPGPYYAAYYLSPRQPGYDDLWSTLVSLLGDAGPPGLSYMGREALEEKLRSGEKMWLEYHFSYPVSLEIFVPYAQEESAFPRRPMDRLIVLQDMDKWESQVFIESETGFYYQVDWGQGLEPLLRRAEMILGEGYKGEDNEDPLPGYYSLREIIEGHPELSSHYSAGPLSIPRDLGTFPTLFYEREDIDINQLASLFFADLNLVRQIKERDEAVIFTDGQRGLRLDSRGLIEYSAPARGEESPVPGYREALTRGIDYVNIYGGWPQGNRLSLTGLEIISMEEKFYRMRLNCNYQGIPVCGQGCFVEMVFNEHGLTSYQRLVCQLEPGEEEFPLREIEEILQGLPAALPHLFSGTQPLKITGCRLVYLPPPGEPQGILRPCWEVELDGHLVIPVDAWSGRVLGENAEETAALEGSPGEAGEGEGLPPEGP